MRRKTLRAPQEHHRIVEGFVFRRLNNIDHHPNVMKFNWEMTPAGGGEVAAVGLDFLLLSDDGRIRCAYQFIATPPPS